MRSKPTERIANLLEEIELFKDWAKAVSLLAENYPDFWQEMPPVPSAEAYAYEMGYRNSRNRAALPTSSIGRSELEKLRDKQEALRYKNMMAQRRSRFNRSEGVYTRGTINHAQLSENERSSLDEDIIASLSKERPSISEELAIQLSKEAEAVAGDISEEAPLTELTFDHPAFNGEGLSTCEDAPKEEKKEDSTPDPSIQPRKDT
jgi:hypothetical protein